MAYEKKKKELSKKVSGKARWGDSMMDGHGVHSEAMKRSPHYKGPFKPK